MMTIKHITISGEESIYPADSVRFTAANPSEFDHVPSTVWRYDSSGESHPHTGGTVFVMNEHGKTVARYDLGASPVPLPADAYLNVANKERPSASGCFSASLRPA